MLIGFMLATVVALPPISPPSQEDDFRAWGLSTLTRVRDSFRLENGLYAEALDEREPAFNWGVGVLMSAMAAAAAEDPAWKAELRAYVEATRAYWNPEGPVAGYDVLPMPKSADRYYDDNAWMVLALVEASDVLGEPKFLTFAEEALKYVLSGEDGALGGGIYWREAKKESKNTCSNGPSAAACLAVYERTREPELLAKAKTLYSWTKTHLQDPEDGLFWDSIRLDGSVGRTKWSYNTALMIRTAATLARLTGEASFREDAERMAEASHKRWIVNGRLADEAKFAFLLVDSWTLVPSSGRARAARDAMRWLQEHGRGPDGWFGSRFDRKPAKDHKPTLIDQAAAVRALLAGGLRREGPAPRARARR
ncbi:MAG: glycoside hydrolase family 76 protein [Fimbriimonadaceae bacterium]|nr:AGE family epimerase/isomerase [Chthonomonadaceae bacterium]MCO5297538.1 glycoside hydrolase family 76 protein [Fimbriimonadaceae bacterium]